MENQTTKPEKFHLWWLNKSNGERLYAGVAFYEEKFSEYRLKIDFLSALQEGSATPFYLRPVGSVEGRTLFKAEAVIKKNGKYAGRRPIGDGYSSAETNGDIIVDLGPYEKALVVTLH